MPEGSIYANEAKGSILRFFRLEADHANIETKKPGTGEFTDIDDNELAAKMVGPIEWSPQDDGTMQASFEVISSGEELETFIENYKSATASDDLEEDLAWHGESYGSSDSGGGDYDLLLAVAGPKSGDSDKRPLVAMACKLVTGSTGGESWTANQRVKKTITVQQIKPKADITIHDGTGQTKTVLDDDFFDNAAETTDLVMTEGSLKYKYFLTDASA